MKRYRVLVAKPGLDGHDRGAKIIARALRDAGMEVIYTGLRQTPEMIAEVALQEDVDAIGLSILSGAHMALIPKVMELLEENEQSNVSIFVGGIIPDDDADLLLKSGVKGVYGPGSDINKIVNDIKNTITEKYQSVSKREIG
jgi:methylmalonyl-CoA mutase, C-terminal domain